MEPSVQPHGEGEDVTSSTGRGTLLAGRYRLDDLLSETRGARFWRAVDTVLVRSVAIHVLPSDDPRAPALLEAARVSATISDQHLLRVLDCDDADGITWVVNEWGEGLSLDLMLQRGTLSASRAAWLVREVAEAIAAGHARGVAHGRLNPESVLVTHAGAVKLIGYVVDAVLEPPRAGDPRYGLLDARESDVINLAGILYAALTGRWPGVAPSAVPAAPYEHRRTLRPRQVRAGVPRTLDAICDRVLTKEASQHSLPIETALEIAAALSDFVGDSPQLAPLDVSGMYAEPTISLHRDALQIEPDTSVFTPRPGFEDTDHPATESTDTDDGPATQAWSAHETNAGSGELIGTPDPPSGTREPVLPIRRRTPPEVEPPAPFEELPERPLFASTERKVPAGAPVWTPPQDQDPTGSGNTSATEPRLQDTGHHTGHQTGHQTGRHAAVSDATDAGFWPFTDEEPSEQHTGKEGRGWLRLALATVAVVVLVLAMILAFNQGRHDNSPSDPSPSPSPSAQATGGVLKVHRVTDFDPQGNPPEENPQLAGRAIDGSAGTGWITATYRGRPDLGGLKSGVGLMLDLGADHQVADVDLRLVGQPTSFEIYAAPSGTTRAPGAPDEMDRVAQVKDADTAVRVPLKPSPKTRFLLVWLTKLPAVSGGFRGEIAEVTVRS